MAIEKLKKATLYTLAKEEEHFLSKLQELGALHIIPFYADKNYTSSQHDQGSSKEALQFLLNAPHIRKQMHTSKSFNPEVVKSKAMKLKIQLQKVLEERDVLKNRINALKPWGDFKLPPLESLDGLRFWFYRVPHRKMALLQERDFIWYSAGKDHRFFYVVVISAKKPALPFERTHVGTQSLLELYGVLEKVENEIEDIEAQRIALTRWIDLYTNNLHQLEDKETFEEVKNQIYTDEELLVIQAWIPEQKVDLIKDFAQKNHAALTIKTPTIKETPPTLLKNSAFTKAGENLLTFYTVPNYWEHDTSSVVFYSFILFFAIILGDVGYGAVFGALVLLFYKKIGKKFFYLLSCLSLSAMLWGALIGSYFGAPLPENSILSHLRLFDINDYDAMMQLSIFIGVFHIVIANALKAADYYRKGPRALMYPPLGWILAIMGGLIMFDLPQIKAVGILLMAIGTVLIFLFTGASEPKLKRLFRGMVALTQITSIFGDILSYLRLVRAGTCNGFDEYGV